MATITAKTLFVPRLFVVQDATFGQRFAALGAALGVQILIAVGAVKLVIFWHKTTGPDGFFTDGALETFLVPVCSVVFKARAPRLDRVAASLARLLEVSDVAVIAEHLILVEGEFSIRPQRFATHVAKETHFVPMSVVCS